MGNQVQCFGRKKNATAVAYVTDGQGFIRVNGKALELLEPTSMRMKVYEPIFLLGAEKFANLNIRVRVRGGGSTTQVMAIRQAICKGLISFHQKFGDESKKREMSCFSSTTRLCWLLIPDAANQRSSAVKELGRVSRSPTDEQQDDYELVECGGLQLYTNRCL